MRRGSVSHVLRQKIGLAHASVAPIYERVWAHPELASFFGELQLRTHQVARASVPLMQSALQVSESSAADAVATALPAYLREHIVEERDHDAWILDDLEVLGYSRDFVLTQIPGPTTARLVGAQYYWINHSHPVALLGYMAALESDVPSEDFISDVIDRTGLPADAFRTLLLHAKLDIAHERDLDALIDDLPLTPFHTRLVNMSALQTVSNLAEMTQEVLLGAGSVS